jgi:hypothetical protein
MFAFNFVVPFTASRTLSSAYGYDAFEVGLVLLSFGLGMLLTPSCLLPLIGPNLGSLAGSLLGGRWSDRKLASLKAANGGVGYPEVRVLSFGSLSRVLIESRCVSEARPGDSVSCRPRCSRSAGCQSSTFTSTRYVSFFFSPVFL